MSPTVIRPAAQRLAKVLIFGPPGQGKTYLLGTAQADERTAPMLLLDFEGGIDTLAGLEIDVVPIRSWDDYNEVYETLASGKHWELDGSSLKEGEQYNSIGIDSVSETHTFALLDILDEAGESRNDPDLLEQRDYGKATVQLRRLLRHFRDLPIHVFYTALSKEVEERGVGRVKVPALAGQMAEEVSGLMSIVGYLAQVEDEDEEIHRELLLQNYPKFRTKVRTPWGATCPDELEDASVTSLLDALEIDSAPEEVPVEEEDEDEEEIEEEEQEEEEGEEPDDDEEDDDDEEEEEDEDEDEDDDDEDEGSEEIESYEELSVPELKEECEARGLKKSGNKKALVERLEEDDEQADDE